jgi:uncharacterized membrane protein YdjX (TVP38/TMEM64 family)
MSDDAVVPPQEGGSGVTQLVAAQLINLVGWVESWDDLGPIVFTGIIAVAIVFCLPCTIFEIIPG